MEFREIMTRFKGARRATPVALREVPSFSATYSCSCGFSFQVVVCHGVGATIPMPDLMRCLGCEEETASWSGDINFTATSLASYYGHAPFLRVPSKRASVLLAKEGRYEAQVVYPLGEDV